MNKQRKHHSTQSSSVQAAVTAAQAGAAGDLPAPTCLRLRATDRDFWIAIVRARAREEWNDAELIVAGNLARALADIERNQGLLDAEGDVLENARGTPIMNPRFAVLEQLCRRTMALCRTLQMQPTLNGKTARDMARKRETERKAREVHRQVANEFDNDSLLA